MSERATFHLHEAAMPTSVADVEAWIGRSVARLVEDLSLDTSIDIKIGSDASVEPWRPIRAEIAGESLRIRLGTLMAGCERDDTTARIADGLARWALGRAQQRRRDNSSDALESAAWGSIAGVTNPDRYGLHEVALHLGPGQWVVAERLARDGAELADGQYGALEDVVDAFRSETLSRYGFAVPLVELVRDPELEPNEFCLRLQGLRFPPQAGLAVDELFILERPGLLRRDGVSGRATLHPTARSVATVSSTLDAVEALGEDGPSLLNAFGYCLLAIQRPLLNHAISLVTDKRIALMLRIAAQTDPFVVAAAADRHGVGGLAQIMGSLALDGVPLEDVPAVLNAILRSGRHGGGDVERLCERARLELRRTLIEPTTTVLPVFTLDPELERRLRRDPDDELRELMLRAVGAAFGAVGEISIRPALLAPADLRRSLADLISVEFPDLRVLSYRDVAIHKEVIPVGSVSAAG